jgi:hypothetical protein
MGANSRRRDDEFAVSPCSPFPQPHGLGHPFCACCAVVILCELFACCLAHKREWLGVVLLVRWLHFFFLVCAVVNRSPKMESILSEACLGVGPEEAKTPQSGGQRQRERMGQIKVENQLPVKRIFAL